MGKLLWEKFWAFHQVRSNWGKNWDEDEKFAGIEYNIWTLHPKITFYTKFDEDLRKSYFTDFWTFGKQNWTFGKHIRTLHLKSGLYTNIDGKVETKIFDRFFTKWKWKMKKLTKMSTVFKLLTQKSSYSPIFLKIWQKNIF